MFSSNCEGFKVNSRVGLVCSWFPPDALGGIGRRTLCYALIKEFGCCACLRVVFRLLFGERPCDIEPTLPLYVLLRLVEIRSIYVLVDLVVQATFPSFRRLCCCLDVKIPCLLIYILGSFFF